MRFNWYYYKINISDPNYTVYNGYFIDDSSANTPTSIYTIILDTGTKDFVQVCQVACNADSQCAVYEVSSDGTCNLFASDAISQIVVYTNTANTGITYNTYVKSNSYTING